MIIKRVEGCTRVLGDGQGYLALPVRDHLINCDVDGPNTPAMTTAWEPTPKELEALNKGATIYLTVLGKVHPPVMLVVGRENVPD